MSANSEAFSAVLDVIWDQVDNSIRPLAEASEFSMDPEIRDRAEQAARHLADASYEIGLLSEYLSSDDSEEDEDE